MGLKEKVKSTVEATKKSILGVFEGECADGTITNKNGLDITKEVWSYLFNSQDYKDGIEHGWFLGFLGHPDDPGCQDFQHACIVMREGHMDENGKVYGKFDLLDTPVGRIVKTMIDAGVRWGISVRGVGDIIANSVDPETFVFRGFDLVTFPAFPDSIPTYTAIAASSDPAQRAKYQNICNAVKANLQEITSATAIDLLQAQFAPQSDEYAALEARKAELDESAHAELGGVAEVPVEEQVDLEDTQTIEPNDSDEEAELMEAKLSAVTDMLVEQLAENHELQIENEALRAELRDTQVEASRKLNSMKRITASQIATSRRSAEASAIEVERAVLAASDAQDKVRSITAAYNTSQSRVAELETKLSDSERSNLTYQQKIEANTQAIKDRDATISGLRTQLRETVTASKSAKAQTSNLDAENRRLSKMLKEYQRAYAQLYASAVGVDLDKVPIEASTSVRELKKIIAGTNTANIPVAPATEFVEVIDEIDEGDLVTL